MGIRNDAQDYFPWWWEATLGGGSAPTAQGGGESIAFETTTAGNIAINALMLWLITNHNMSYEQAKEIAEKYKNKVHPPLINEHSPKQEKETTIPHDVRLSQTLPLTGNTDIGKGIPQVKPITAPAEEETRIPFDVKLSQELPLTGNTDIGKGIPQVKPITAPAEEETRIPFDVRLSQELPLTGNTDIGKGIPQIKPITAPAEEETRIPFDVRLSQELPLTGNTDIGKGIPKVIGNTNIGEGIGNDLPMIKPIENQQASDIPYMGQYVEGIGVIPQWKYEQIQGRDIAGFLNAIGGAIPREKEGTTTNVIEKEKVDAIEKEETKNGKGTTEEEDEENIKIPIIIPNINQGETGMPELQDVTKQNEEYNIDYSGLEKWLLDMQKRQWDREDQIRKETQEREDTAYQRAVEDARKAGINVNLMDIQPATSGGGISTATGIYSGLLESAMSGHSNRFINSANIGSNEYIAELNNATKILEAQINNNFKGDENDKQRFMDLIGEIISSAAMIFAFSKGGK